VLCAQHASNIGAQSICINTADTDILIYSFYFNDKFIAVKERIKIINVREIASEHGQGYCLAFTPLRNVTGNDYIK